MNDIRSNEKLKYCMVGIYKKLVDEVDPKYIMDLLIEKWVISVEEREEIMTCNTRQERCRTMLNKFFLTSNPKAFIILRQALEKNYHWITDELDAACSHVNIEHEGNHVQKQCTSIFNGGMQKEEKLHKLTQQLTNQVQELQNQLKSKDEEIANLKNHCAIIEEQIKHIISSTMENETMSHSDICLDEADGPYEESIPEESVHDDMKTFVKESFTRLVKLPRYCQSTYDLWAGHFGEMSEPVCLKELHDGDKNINCFPEITLLKGLKHPRIANLLGRSPFDSPKPYIVLESSSHTNVLKYLKKSNFSLSNTILVEWIVQMASGIEFLHDNSIIHRSIFASNLIICNFGQSIKITNFQNATTLGMRNYLLESGPLPRAEYSAPELISEKKWSMATDVWSFGLTALKIWIMGSKIFPEMTRKDIVEFFAGAKEEHIVDLVNRHMKNHRKINETIRRCLSLNESDRPDVTELSFHDQYMASDKTDFGNKRKFEHMIVCKKPVRGITSLSGVLYVILMCSSSIKCFDIKNGLLMMKAIKLGASGRSKVKAYFKHKKLQYQVSKNLQSLCQDARTQSLFVLDYGQYSVLQISVQRQKITNHWKAPADARCLSVTFKGTILVGCCSSECVAVEYSSEGSLLSKIGGGRIINEPLSVLRVDQLHYLILHGDIYTADHLDLCAIDSDGVPSSGYSRQTFNSKVSDVAVHIPSGKILVADAHENRIMIVDKYLINRPKELLNVHDGITAPSSLYVLEDRLYVGLTNGNIYCFEFS